jgi:hypothetical protein
MLGAKAGRHQELWSETLCRLGRSARDPTSQSEECMAVMTAKAPRHLPVVEGGRLVGVVSIGDRVKSVIGDQKFIIEQLEHFIHGDR